jgi:hypothetical protein
MSDKTKISWTDASWNPVPTHLGYLVNLQGGIIGPMGKILKPMSNRSGHLYILTPPPRRPRKLFIHRAVLLTFRGPCPEGCESRHLDGNPENNNLDNLAWGTRQEQREDERRHGTRCCGEKSGTAKLTEDQVRSIRSERKTNSLRTLAFRYHVSHTTILAAITGHHWRNTL